MLNLIAVIGCGVLFRLDGWGKNDGFLPFWPFNKLRSGGINYARYGIPLVVWIVTHNPWYLLSYGVVISIPYGEKHFWMKYKLASWWFIGILFGIASLHPGFALWFSCIVVIAKRFNLDHSLLEFFVLGIGSTLWLLFR